MARKTALTRNSAGLPSLAKSRPSKSKPVQGNCKPNSVCVPPRRNGENHLSERPIPESLIHQLRWTLERTTPSLLFGLAPGGVFRAPAISRRAVVSYTTFSPLPLCCQRGGIFSVALSVSTP